MKIGVLALQGAFHLHRPQIEAAGAEYVEVISQTDFARIDGLILPGGESSTMLTLIQALELKGVLREFFNSKPAWGICAGAILMAKNVKNPDQFSFGAVDIEITRNGYGRQMDSFEESIHGYDVSFIRAPIISRVGSGLQILHEGQGPTWIESERHMITTFHPELNSTYPSPWHRRFVDHTA